MLYSADALRSYDLRSTDGVLGKIEDFYFDDRFWAVRYLVVETDGWLVQRRVLISPRAVVAVDIHSDTIATKLTKAQIAASPAPDEHAPVSRQFEIAYNEFYEYSPYWIGPLAWGANGAPRPPEDAAPLEERESWDSHLYSARDLTGFTRYRVAAKDGHVGHVADLILSDGGLGDPLSGGQHAGLVARQARAGTAAVDEGLLGGRHAHRGPDPGGHQIGAGVRGRRSYRPGVRGQALRPLLPAGVLDGRRGLLRPSRDGHRRTLIRAARPRPSWRTHAETHANAAHRLQSPLR